MRDLDLKSLRLWVAVCECGSILKAARLEHIEPSAVSKRIAALEDALGTPLLVRGRRGVRPTPAGSAMLEQARGVLFAAERMAADAAAHAGGLRGQVRLVASASGVAESLLDDVAAFLRDPAHAGIKVDIEEHLSADVVRLVREGSASLGICWDVADLSGLHTAPWRGDELVLAVPVDHPLAGHSRIGYDESLAFPHVGLKPGSAVHAALHRAAARAGRLIDYRVVVSTFDAAIRVVKAGLGIGVLPREVSLPYVQAGELCAVALTDDWAMRRFALCFRDRAALTPAAVRMVEFLLARARSADPSAPAGVQPPEQAATASPAGAGATPASNAISRPRPRPRAGSGRAPATRKAP